MRDQSHRGRSSAAAVVAAYVTPARSSALTAQSALLLAFGSQSRHIGAITLAVLVALKSVEALVVRAVRRRPRDARRPR